MKTLFLFTLTLIISLNLNARENPFAATNAYEEEAARIIEQNELDDDQIDESQYIQEMQEKMDSMHIENKKKEDEKEALRKNEKKKILQVKMKNEKMKKEALLKEEKKKILETAYSKHQVEKLIKNAQKENELKTKKLLQKEIEKRESFKPEEVIYVKPRLDVIEEDVMKTKSILPFLELSYNNEQLNIKSIYKVSKKFTLDKDKKIIIDYRAKEQFSTKRENLLTEAYKKVAVGNHKSKGFFRVVIQLESKPSMYKVNYDDNQSISIVKINKIR